MEVIRPSTPMPLGRALTEYDCYQMQRHSSDLLPPLQPLIEENNSKRLCARRNQKVCQATRLKPRRHIVSSREGESVELIALSSKKGADLYKGDRSRTVLPELNSERLLAGREESDTLFIESTLELKCAKRNNRLSPVRTRSINQNRQSTAAKNDSSSQSSNSAGLPIVAANPKNNLNTNCNSSNTTALQKHIEQQEKDYDSALIKADIFQRWIKSQQE